MTRLLLLLVLCFLSLPLLAEGGADGGNGGYAMVCRTREGKIWKLEMQDLWWGQTELELTIHRSARPASEQIKAKADLLLRTDPKYFAGLDDEIDRFEKQKRFAPSRVRNPHDIYSNVVPISNDPGEPCASEPVVNYGNDGKIELTVELWQYLTAPEHRNTRLESDLAAFYLHEGIYKIIRNHAEHPHTSRKAATIVAHLFALDQEADFQHWYRSFKWRSAGEEAPDAEILIREGLQSAVYHSANPAADQQAALAEWERRCETWKAEARARTQPLVSTRRLSCGDGELQKFEDGSRQIVSEATLEAVFLNPVLLMTEAVHGDYVGNWPHADEMAAQSFDRACESWKREIQGRFGNRLLWVSCGLRADRNAEVSVVGTSETKRIGHHSLAAGTFVLSDPGAIVERHTRLHGTAYGVDPGRELDAVYWAWQTYRNACARWKAEQLAFSKTIHATCEPGGGVHDFLRLKTLSGNAVQFESVGRVFQLK